jgi:hypothetical protein
MGHSQGAQAGVAFLPYEPEVRAAVLSGAGANLLRAILAKSEPKVSLGGNEYPPRDLLQFAFQERPDRPISSNHPLLQLFNTFVNRSDGDVYGPLLRKGAAPDIGGKHLLMYIGHVDNYTPLRSAAALAINAGLAIGGSNLFPAPCDRYDPDEQKVCGYSISGFMPVTPLPASGNAGDATAIVPDARPARRQGRPLRRLHPRPELGRIVGFIDSAPRRRHPGRVRLMPGNAAPPIRCRHCNKTCTASERPAASAVAPARPVAKDIRPSGPSAPEHALPRVSQTTRPARRSHGHQRPLA